VASFSFQNTYGNYQEGIGKLPSLQQWLSIHHPSISLKIDRLVKGGPYSRSLIIFNNVIKALQEVEGAPKFYSCDFSHQYVRFGGYGNIWGLVTVDPDGISNFVFLPSAALSCGSFQFLSLHLSAGHILPIAIGHQCGSESEDSWSWFFAEILSAFPEFENAAILMDRDKGGDSASRYFVLYFWLLCILGEKHVFFPEISCLRPMCNHVQCTSAIMSGSAMGRRQQGCSSLQLRRRLNEAFILILQSFSSKSSLFL
jgi:hypothetical protein